MASYDNWKLRSDRDDDERGQERQSDIDEMGQELDRQNEVISDLLLAAKEAALVIVQIADAHGARAMTGTCLPRLLAAIKQAEG